MNVQDSVTPLVRVKLFEHQRNALKSALRQLLSPNGGDVPFSKTGAGYALLMEM